MKKQLVFVLSVLMKMRQQCFASLKNRSVLGLLMCIVILVSFTTKVYTQTDWIKNSENPVMNVGPWGEWDHELVGTPCVLYDGTTYQMWYCGSGDGTLFRIGYANSPDGISWFEYLDNPVLDLGPAGSWDDDTIYFPYVIFDNVTSTYKMWYIGSEGPPDYYERTGYATSTDGITWTKHPDPVLDVGPAGSWDDEVAGGGYVLFDGTTYHMWYSGYDGTYFRIGYATSLDGIIWTKHPENPVMDVGPVGSWYYPRVQDPKIIFDGTTYHMWFSGGDIFTWRIGYATSPDGFIWTIRPDPVLDVGLAGSWESLYVGLCSVLFDNPTSTFMMWYTGGSSSWEGEIGYATSTTTGIDDNIIVQTNVYLHQNFPNPFNPSTTISFTLTAEDGENAELIIYNIKGQKVKEFLIVSPSPGHTLSVTWDGTDDNNKPVGSGIYLYQLRTGDKNSQTR
ncbi:MAG: T9SS type A sorting domain-containing protein, partial [Candidatus Cloacimonetes bacterium]|nr:T9SS type A sorting domain-containing protein [Candidatus Cloacimonadota bacterium]